MLVESKKTFKHGFILTEAEIRRFVDLIDEQILKIPEKSKTKIIFNVKFKNGAIAEILSLDEILSQENFGFAQIVRLKIQWVIDVEKEDPIISLEFINVELDDDSSSPSIRIVIREKSRDWVFVTSSLLEERIAKIKRYNFKRTDKSGISSSVFVLTMPIWFLILMAIMMYGAFSFESNKPKNSQILETAWKNGEIQDPIEALILLQKSNEEIYGTGIESLMHMFINKPMLIVIGIIILLIFLFIIFEKYYPLYNFCWGDYLDYFRKRENTRKFILVVILVGIIVSFIGGVLASFAGKIG